eukprot:5683672-Prymnesium_polylepis.1
MCRCAGVPVCRPDELRRAFVEACGLKADTGSGWDAPAVGQMTLFGFVEALLILAPRAHGGEAAPAGGLAPSVQALVARAWRCSEAAAEERGGAARVSGGGPHGRRG